MQRFAREGPCLLGIFARSRAGGEYLARCDWRSETNRNPTLSALWKTGGSYFASQPTPARRASCLIAPRDALVVRAA